MRIVDYPSIIKTAWENYDPNRSVVSVEDISAKVSTNHVFRVRLDSDELVIAKLSYFGVFEHFKEDHTIIHALANNLLYPYENVLAKSLVKDNEVYTYRFQNSLVDTWVVFYNPIRIANRLPRRLDEPAIQKLGHEMATFHKACLRVGKILPQSSKTVRTDIQELLDILQTETGQFEYRLHIDTIKEHCERFLRNIDELDIKSFDKLPVFVDWNIGNFSVTEDLKLFSRWDYDWFRISNRMMDFYFFSRVVSDIGDRTVFSYGINTLNEPRFLLFLKAYHAVYPLTANEIRFLKEAYRFFILNYVIKYGRYFFHRTYSTKLQKEAYELYLPSVDRDFKADLILKELGISEA